MIRLLLILAFCSSFLVYSQSDTTAKKEKNVNWAVVPSPSYNPVQGFGLTMIGGLFYPMSKKDTVSNPSSTFLYGFYAENKSWIGAVFQEGYFNRNNYWFDLLAVTGEFRFRFYPLGPENDFTINYATQINIIEGNFLRRVYGKFYAGIHWKFSNFSTEFTPNGNLPIDIDLPEFSRQNQYSGMGVKIAYDSRNNNLNPSSGMLVNAYTGHFRSGIGSDRSFDVLEADYNYYWGLAPKHVLAFRFYSFSGFGDVPFEEQAILGFAGARGNDVRGYSSGKYRGNQLYDIQTEWRFNVYNRWGMVAFGSLALTGNDGDEISKNGLLPAIGTGIRFMAATDRKVNIGLDVAVGKGDYGIYFAISEAF